MRLRQDRGRHRKNGRNVTFSDMSMDEQEMVDFGYVESDPFLGPSSAFGAMSIFMSVFVVVFVAVVIFIIFVAIRNYKASKKAGLDPFTLQTELAVRAANSQMLAPRQSREKRLAELEDLLARQVITREEYAQARMKILTED